MTSAPITTQPTAPFLPTRKNTRAITSKRLILGPGPDPEPPVTPDPVPPVTPDPERLARPDPQAPHTPKAPSAPGHPPKKAPLPGRKPGRPAKMRSITTAMYMFLFILLCLISFSGYAGYSLPRAQADSTEPTMIQSPASGGATDYSGNWKWNNIVQIYESAYDPVKKSFFVSNPVSIASELTGQFAVVALLKDRNSDDSDVIIKYLYYVKDKWGTSKIRNDTYFLRYNFKGSASDFNALSSQKKISRTFDGNQKFFLVKLSVFKAHAVSVPNKIMTGGSLGFGIINYPFKFRPQKHMQDFSGSFNVGAAVAYTLRHDSLSKWSHSFVGGFGISSITLDKASVSTNAGALDSSNGLTALTLSVGYMLEYSKIQIGVFMGVDRISNLNNSTYGWKFQGNPWFSIGLGYSIFSTNNSTSQTSTADTQP
jgi:hypothetical protein